MRYSPETLAGYFDAGFDTVIDVRAPSEFAEDHLPGAINLPALSDAERAEVGTIYTRESPFRARKIGAAMVARNVAAHLEGPLSGKEGRWRPLVYCWRGGQRSGSVATILAAVGWRVETLAGGYQSYRRAVVRALYTDPVPGRVVLIDGNTGTAKTAVLAALAAHGAQVIDLEGLARHRGSVLGAMRGGQPGQKAFETALAQVVANLDPDRPVFIEAESSRVGARIVPPMLWDAMRAAPRIEIAAPLEARATYLARAYGDLTDEPARLDAALDKLVRLRGREVVEEWRAMAAQGAFEALAASLCERHYDPAYRKSRARWEADPVARIDAERLDREGIDAIAGDILNLPL